jgi:hypothetical protein
VAAVALPAGIDGLSLLARRFFLWLGEQKHPAAWGVGDDLALLDGVCRGRRIAEIALDLSFDSAAVIDRFKVLSEPSRDVKGKMTLDGQKAMLDALRLRAEAVRV